MILNLTHIQNDVSVWGKLPLDGISTMARKTKMMLRVEDSYQRPLESLLPEMINEKGLSATAGELGISNATLGYWLLKLRIEVRRIALAPGETLEVKRDR